MNLLEKAVLKIGDVFIWSLVAIEFVFIALAIAVFLPIILIMNMLIPLTVEQTEELN